MSTYAFLNPILTPAAQAAVAADSSIVTTLILVLLGIGTFITLAWYIGYATGKGKILREEAKKAREEKKKGGGKTAGKGGR